MGLILLPLFLPSPAGGCHSFITLSGANHRLDTRGQHLLCGSKTLGRRSTEGSTILGTLIDARAVVWSQVNHYYLTLLFAYS